MSLQGTLSTLGITEVLEFLAQREATGHLEIKTEMGSAKYSFSEGAVGQCEYSFIRESGDDSAEATYYVVSELDGTFFFDEDDAPGTMESTETVADVLSRTAEIAEKWGDVEQKIATPNHLLVRNTELDGSVTIQPEWWKTLEVIGDGKTSLQVAAATERGLLDASLLVLDMANAGLLNVEQIDPLSLEIPDISADASVEAPLLENTAGLEATDVEETAEIADVEPVVELEVEPLTAPEAPTIPDMALGDDAPGESDIDETSAEETPAPAVVAMDAPAPVTSAFDEAPIEPVTVPAPMAETPAQSFEPAFQSPAPVADLAPAPAAEIVAPAPAPAPDLAPAPVPTADFAPAPAAEIVAPAPAPAPDLAPAPVATTDFAPAPAAEIVAPAPAPDFAPAPAAEFVAPAPAPEAPIPAPVASDENDGWASNHSPSYDPTHAPAPAPAPAPAAPVAAPAVTPVASIGADQDSTAVAGEVLSDLAAMTEGLDEQQPAGQNWELDATFATDATETPAPPADADPFGALDNLLADEEAEDADRGSVLKFLRRD